MRLSGKTLHRLFIPARKKVFRLLLVPMPVWGRDQFLGLRHGQRGEEVGEDEPQRAAEPDVEEVREICVADVVVVGRIGGDYFVKH